MMPALEGASGRDLGGVALRPDFCPEVCAPPGWLGGFLATSLDVHSFRGGTESQHDSQPGGVMRAGMRVGVIDTDIQSPGIHVLFGIAGDDVHASLNDFLWHGEPISEVAQDVTANVGVELVRSDPPHPVEHAARRDRPDPA